jgi:hypothetical protein
VKLAANRPSLFDRFRAEQRQAGPRGGLDVKGLRRDHDEVASILVIP